jgi:hypothetical protein
VRRGRDFIPNAVLRLLPESPMMAESPT